MKPNRLSVGQTQGRVALDVTVAIADIPGDTGRNSLGLITLRVSGNRKAGAAARQQYDKSAAPLLTTEWCPW